MRSSALALCLGLLAPSLASAAVLDRVMAVVNDDVVTLSEVYEVGGSFIQQRCPGNAEACVKAAEVEVLDSLIDRALVRQELERLEQTVTAEDVDHAIDQIARDNGLEERALFREAVEGQGVAWEDYREQLTEQLRQMKFNEAVLRTRVVITDDEVLDRYKRSVGDLAQPELLDLGGVGIALPTDPTERATALQVIGELVTALNAGEASWETVVAERDALGRGGSMGRMAASELSPDISAALEGLEDGKVSAPILLGDLALLVRVDGRTASGVLPFEEVEGRLKDALFQQKLQEEQARWAKQARRRSAVRVIAE